MSNLLGVSASRCQFAGTLSITGNRALGNTFDAASAGKIVSQGIVARDADVDCFETENSICLAYGSPRFLIGEIDSIAQSNGQAAAWAKALRQFGANAPRDIRGRFVAVYIQIPDNTVTIVTDRFGSWPACYADSGSEFYFSDRADTVPAPSRALSSQAIFDYLYFHNVPGPNTIYEQVNRIPPASILGWRNGELTCDTYWRPAFQPNSNPDLNKYCDDFLRIVEESVAQESRGHARVAAFLSGGTDSSTVAGMLSRLSDSKVSTYSIGFDASGYDEMQYARIAAEHFGLEHHEFYITPDDLIEGMPLIAASYDQPFGNSSALPGWYCAQQAKKDGFDKVLAGDGGDELFAGNTRYSQQFVFEAYHHLPAPLRRSFLEPLFLSDFVSNLPLIRKVSSYVKQARLTLPDRFQTYNLLLRTGIEDVLEPDFLSSVDIGHPNQLQRETWDSLDGLPVLNHMLAFEWRYTLTNNDLPKVVGTARMSDLEVGFPLLSDELVEFSQTIPPKWQIKHLKLRWFFKHALRDFLPKEILSKKKHGFGLPFGVWACENPDLMAYASQHAANFARRGIVKESFIRVLMRDLLPAHPGYYGELLWIFVMLELWLTQHEDRSL